jgi:hypothetical protein
VEDLLGWKAMPFALEDFDSNYPNRQNLQVLVSRYVQRIAYLREHIRGERSHLDCCGEKLTVRASRTQAFQVGKCPSTYGNVGTPYDAERR